MKQNVITYRKHTILEVNPRINKITFAFCSTRTASEAPPSFESTELFLLSRFFLSYSAYLDSLYPRGSSKSTLQSVSMIEAAPDGCTSRTSKKYFLSACGMQMVSPTVKHVNLRRATSRSALGLDTSKKSTD